MRHIVLLGTLTLLASACTDARDTLAPPIDPQRSPAGDAPVVILRTGPGGAGSSGNAPVVSTLADAVDRVAPGGTIRVLPGTYTAAEVVVGKPIRIVGIGNELPVITGDGHWRQIVIQSTGGGIVEFRHIRFENPGSFTAVFVSIDGRAEFAECEFVGGPSAVSGIVLAPETVGEEPDLVVRDSRFTGHLLGVFGTRGGRGDLIDNHFEGQTWAAFQYQGGNGGRIQGNHAVGCGPVGCFNLFRSADAELIGNTAVVEPDVPRQSAIGVVTVDGARVLVRGNRITTDGPSTTRVFTRAGIWVHSNGGAEVVVEDNFVESSEEGINLLARGGGNIVARDNHIDGSDLALGTLTFGGTAHVYRNDFTSYTDAMNVLEGTDATCNWWGSASGPQGAVTAPSPDAYTPWATSPAAGSGAMTCSGGI